MRPDCLKDVSKFEILGAAGDWSVEKSTFSRKSPPFVREVRHLIINLADFWVMVGRRPLTRRFYRVKVKRRLAGTLDLPTGKLHLANQINRMRRGYFFFMGEKVRMRVHNNTYMDIF